MVEVAPWPTAAQPTAKRLESMTNALVFGNLTISFLRPATSRCLQQLLSLARTLTAINSLAFAWRGNLLAADTLQPKQI